MSESEVNRLAQALGRIEERVVAIKERLDAIESVGRSKRRDITQVAMNMVAGIGSAWLLIHFKLR